MISVSISANDFERLRSYLFTEDGFENAVFGTCGSSIDGKHISLYVQKLFHVSEEDYMARSAYHLEVSPQFINGVIDATQQKFAILMIHSHPGNLMPDYSISDNQGEARLFEVFHDILPSKPHASLLFSSKATKGRMWNKGQFQNIDELKVVGASFRKVPLITQKKTAEENQGIYDRQVLAFGDEIQSELEAIRVGIIGVGGTGSCVAEQLARLGVKDFVLVDNDRFEPSNITRTYGSRVSDLSGNQHKTKIGARNLHSINPLIHVRELTESITDQETLMQLRDRDVIFCCTDNDLSRSMINRFSYQYFVPVIDMGVRIVAEKSRVLAAAGRASMIAPGMPCLRCSYHLDPERIRVESLDPIERARLLKEGYIQGAEVRVPAVISLNSTLSSLAVTTFLSSLSGFSEVPSHASEQIYDAVEGVIFKSHPRNDPDCTVCGPKGLTALGDQQIVSSYGAKRTARNPQTS